MARPRTFDPDEILDIALEVFWRKGFRGTSLDDITAESGLAKPSLYAAFGDKNALFLKVLDRYHDRIIARAEKLLARGSSARDAISGWLESFLPYCSGSKGTRGCLSINNATEFPADQTDLLASVDPPTARNRPRSVLQGFQPHGCRLLYHDALQRADGDGAAGAERSQCQSCHPNRHVLARLTQASHYVL